jgi:hypothetical protein
MHNKELHRLYSSTNFILIKNLRRVREEGSRVTEETRNVFRWRTRMGRDRWVDLGLESMIILQWMLELLV